MKAWCLNAECGWASLTDTEEAVIECPFCEAPALVYTEDVIPQFIEERKNATDLNSTTREEYLHSPDPQ